MPAAKLKILGLDTVTEACSVALSARGEIFERFEITANAHSRRVLGMVESVLREGGVKLAELDALAVDAGPGAFTGVRLGLGVAQGLAYAYQTPVIAVASTEVLAAAVPNATVFAAFDARMGQIYCGAYRTGAECAPPRQLSPPKLIAPRDVVCEANKVVGVGSGWDAYEQILQNKFSAAKVLHKKFPRAATLVKLAAARGAAAAVSPVELRALYIRDEVAARG